MNFLLQLGPYFYEEKIDLEGTNITTYRGLNVELLMTMATYFNFTQVSNLFHFPKLY